jgi:predicted nucleic acid-binding protein
MNSIVVADAGPLLYLVLIDCADLLEKLFDRVFVPAGVRDELLDRGAPETVRTWIGLEKSWLSVEPVTLPQAIRGLQIRASGVLMDDLDGRTAARRLDIPVIGTVGVLERAAELKLMELPEAIAKLRRTNFFASPELLDAALERDRKRRTE